MAVSIATAEEIILGLNNTQEEFVKAYGAAKASGPWDTRTHVNIAGNYGFLKDEKVIYSEFKTPTFMLIAYFDEAGKPLVLNYLLEILSPSYQVAYPDYDLDRVKVFLEKNKGKAKWKEYEETKTRLYDGSDRMLFIEHDTKHLIKIGACLSNALKQNK